MITILTGDCIEQMRTLPEKSVQCCVTSPPYWGLRDYGTASWEGGSDECDHAPVSGIQGATGDRVSRTFTGAIPQGWTCSRCGAIRIDQQIGLEPTPKEFVAKMVAVFTEVWRVLKDDGTLWVNLGSSYASHPGQRKPTDKAGPKQQSCRGSTATPSRHASSGGIDPSQSLPPQHDPACDSDGTTPQDWLGSDLSCPDCGGELTACSQSRHAGTSGTSLRSGQGAQQPSRISHGNGHRDYASTSLLSSLPSVVPSTNPSSTQNAQDASFPEGAASGRQTERPPFSDDAHQFEHRTVYTSDTFQNVGPSSSHTKDRAHVCTACGYSTRMHPAFKAKDMVPIPWMVAMALQEAGWYLRSDIIWHKPNPMPESVTDRPTKSHEYIFLLTKNERYSYNAEAIREPHAQESIARVSRGRSESHKYSDGGPVNQTLAADISKACHPDGRNKRSVWTIPSAPYKEAHFATYPPDLIKPCILAGSKPGDVILDPFGGSGTTGMVANELGRDAVLIELNPQYVDLIKKRTDTTPGLPLH